MATVTLKSTPITNADATPKVTNNPGVTDGMLRRAVGTLENEAADDVGSTYRMVRVPSNAHISRVEYAADAAGATGQVNIGVYQTAANGGAVVDEDFFASALDPGAAAIGRTEVTHESAVYGLEDVEKALWTALGLSADPGIDYDIVITCSEIIADVGTQTLWVEYV